MGFDAAMRALLVIATLCFGSTAMAADKCERQALVSAVAKLPGSKELRVTKGPTQVTLTDVATQRVVLEATCDGLKIPMAEGLAKDKKVVRDERYTVSVTTRGAVSLSIAAGLASLDGIEVVSFDDDSMNLTDSRGRLWYSLVTHADGTLVETEGGHNGCGCERTTSPAGQQVTRRL